MFYETIKRIFSKKTASWSITQLSTTVDKKSRKPMNKITDLFCIGTNFIAEFLVLVLSGCATNKIVIAEVPISPAEHYKHFLDQEDLSIAIDPFFEEAKA